jgi:hypothetical protein
MGRYSFFLALTITLAFSGPLASDSIEQLTLIEEYLDDPSPQPHSHELYNRCTSFLLQKLFQQRMESLSQLDIGSEEFLLLSQIEALKSTGFSEEEFKKGKQQLMMQMDSFYSKVESAGKLSLQAHEVMTVCKACVEKIQLADLASPLATFLNEDPSGLRLLYPEPAHWVYERPEDMYLRLADNPITQEPLFFINSPSGQIEPFYQLPLNEKEKKLIFELMKTIGEKNVWGLLFKKKEVEKLGKRVNHVHPMRFIGYILADPKMKKWLKNVRNSSFKWDHFIDGFSDRMKEEHAKNNIMHHVAGFSHLLSVDPNEITSYIENRDYEGLVKSLL